MNICVLRVISKLRHLSQSEIAKMAQVSKQAVSLWFQKGSMTINVQSKHLQSLAEALHLNVDDLLRPLDCMSHLHDRAPLEAALLWDHLYPNLEDFVIALVQHKHQALSRLVEVYGLFQSQKMMGKVIPVLFPKYKKYLPPVRRRQCESLWHLQKNQNLN